MEPIVRPIMRERLKELAEAGFGGERGQKAIIRSIVHKLIQP